MGCSLVLDWSGGYAGDPDLSRGRCRCRTLTIAMQIADAFGRHARRGIVHRDLKPGQHHGHARRRPFKIRLGLAKVLLPRPRC